MCPSHCQWNNGACEAKYFYMLGYPGTNDCLTGWRNVLSKSRCKESVKDLLGYHDMTFDESAKQMPDKYPKGCFTFSSGWGAGSLYWNPNIGTPQHPSSDASPVCYELAKEP